MKKFDTSFSENLVSPFTMVVLKKLDKLFLYKKCSQKMIHIIVKFTIKAYFKLQIALWRHSKDSWFPSCAQFHGR